MATNSKYIEEIANQQLLTDAEERELAAKIKIGDAKALEELTKANLKFVVSLAHQYRNRGLGEDDLISEGNIGMMHAAQKFDGTKGTRFVKFAATYIRKAMEEAIPIKYRMLERINNAPAKPTRYLSTSPYLLAAMATSPCKASWKTRTLHKPTSI